MVPNSLGRSTSASVSVSVLPWQTLTPSTSTPNGSCPREFPARYVLQGALLSLQKYFGECKIDTNRHLPIRLHLRNLPTGQRAWRWTSAILACLTNAIYKFAFALTARRYAGYLLSHLQPTPTHRLRHRFIVNADTDTFLTGLDTSTPILFVTTMFFELPLLHITTPTSRR